MRPIWKGNISFGLVNIPINLYSATEDQGINFDLLHEPDSGRIRYARFCQKENREVPYEEIIKGYNYYEDRYVILTDEDFQKVDLKKSSTIEILSFSDLAEIDTIYYEKPYFLESQKGAEKSFELLRQALDETQKVGVAKFVLRNKEHLLILKSAGQHLIINQLRFAQEIRNIKSIKVPDITTNTQEIDLAITLINKLAKKFNIAEYQDTYTAQLKELIIKKSKGQTIRAAGKAPEPTEIEDLMAALKESIAKTK